MKMKLVCWSAVALMMMGQVGCHHDKVYDDVISDSHTTVRLHNSEWGPCYVVYLTEQDSYSAIQSEAETVGIKLSESPLVEYRPFSDEVVKRYKSAFVIWGVGGLGRARGFLWEAFVGNETNRTNGIQWSEFLRLVKEQGPEPKLSDLYD